MSEELALPEPGDLLVDRYEVVAQLGAGGMGVVYRCHDRERDEAVAVKVLKSAVAGARVMREAKAASVLDAAYAAPVFDTGRLASGAPYLAMELLTGHTLRDELNARGRLPVDESCALALQVCAALAGAHVRGIVHRDIKPSNLHVESDGDDRRLRVLDFGIAKLNTSLDEGGTLTATGTVMGSPKYMSPEQLRDSKAADARSDIWSLGVVLYEMLAGRPPFDAEQAEAVCAMIAADPAPPLEDVPDDVARIVERCLEKNRQHRFVNVGDLARALARSAGPGAPEHLDAVTAAMPVETEVTATIEPPPTEATTATDGEVEPEEAAASRGTLRWLAAIAGVGAVVWGLSATRSPSPSTSAPPELPTEALSPLAPSATIPTATAAIASASAPASATPPAPVATTLPVPRPPVAVPRPAATTQPVVERDDPLDDRR